MKWLTGILLGIMVASLAVANPKGRYANLEQNPNCDVYFNFIDIGVVYVPNPNGGRTKRAIWKLYGNKLVITSDFWGGLYHYDKDKDQLVWQSLTMGSETHDVTSLYSVSERTLSACP